MPRPHERRPLLVLIHSRPRELLPEEEHVEDPHRVEDVDDGREQRVGDLQGDGLLSQACRCRRRRAVRARRGSGANKQDGAHQIRKFPLCAPESSRV